MQPSAISFNAIRSLDGSQHKAFEELCAQLARAEFEGRGTFVRKGTPDAGVECYGTHADGSQWAWQAKYFDRFEDSQWNQMNESVQTALRSHPQMTRFFMCVPKDLPDARAPRRKSAKEKWDSQVAQWEADAAALGMQVEFVFWGEHELLDRLQAPQHAGRVRFWFDVARFDRQWFSARLDEAVLTAANRYSPTMHVSLPIEEHFDALMLTSAFYNRIGRTIHSAYRSARRADEVAAKLTQPRLISAYRDFVKGFQGIQPHLAKFLPDADTQLPADELPALLDQLREAVTALMRTAETLLQEEALNKATGRPEQRQSAARLEALLRALGELYEPVDDMEEQLLRGAAMANSRLLVLEGAAGTGKTHLLCDTATRLLSAGHPVVLLLGQQFTTTNNPWDQALSLLSLPGLGGPEFVGALESAAQAAGKRAVILIDAINEGQGRTIWPAHAATFLAHVAKSPWLCVAMSVRSSFRDDVLPQDTLARAKVLTHHGFGESTPEAIQRYFAYYGLDYPSIPLLSSELSNPLFLKALCTGMKHLGVRHIPRGHGGLTWAFTQYLDAINQSVSEKLGLKPARKVPRKALGMVIDAMRKRGTRWLPEEEVETLLTALHPSTTYDQSLLRQLLDEGVLSVEVTTDGEVVRVSFERLADHLWAQALLDEHLTGDPEAWFAADSTLSTEIARIGFHQGLLEALCIQVPERCGRELARLVPKLTERRNFIDVYRESLIWRAPQSIHGDALDLLEALSTSRHARLRNEDAMLSLATVPAHPFNAHSLHERLIAMSMPERDETWSTAMYQLWASEDAPRKLVGWARLFPADIALDDEALQLWATALTWMLTSSHRYLRDGATKALVALLAPRPKAVPSWLEKFATVNDPYVAERVYAVAYGVALRIPDSAAVGAIAEVTYRLVFADGAPPPHVLLRDYARGVIERACHLGVPISFNPENARPPYQSAWPELPSEQDIEELIAGFPEGREGRGARQIEHSVLSGDFARYVLGTNSSANLREWLDVKLDDLPSMPADPETRLEQWCAALTETERKAYDAVEAHEQSLSLARFKDSVRAYELALGVKGSAKKKAKKTSIAASAAPDPREALDKLLGQQRSEELAALKSDVSSRSWPARLNARPLQLHILRRVFELGWTSRAFGEFDCVTVSARGRESAKPERIGKKYQWIAYHELLAFLSDRYALFERDQGKRRGVVYDGPWRLSVRNLDPSDISHPEQEHQVRDDEMSRPEVPMRWDRFSDATAWMESMDDLPDLPSLLLPRTSDGTLFVRAQAYVDVEITPPFTATFEGFERRNFHLVANGYLIAEDKAEAFVEWAARMFDSNGSLPNPPDIHEVFVGEHGWSPAARYFSQPYYGDDGWSKPEGSPGDLRRVAVNYLHEANGFDCSVPRTFSLTLPSTDLIGGMGLRWTGAGGDFVGACGTLLAFDPSGADDGKSGLLLQQKSLSEYLKKHRLTVVWSVRGEKLTLPEEIGADTSTQSWLSLSGALRLDKDAIVGTLCGRVEVPAQNGEGRRDLTPIVFGPTNTSVQRSRRRAASKRVPKTDSK